MSVPVRNFLTNRRNRAVGAIMGHLEREIFPGLSTKQQDDLRRTVRDAISGYHDAVLDLVKAEDDTTVRNDAVVDAIERLDRKVTRAIRPAVATTP